MGVVSLFCLGMVGCREALLSLPTGGNVWKGAESFSILLDYSDCCLVVHFDALILKDQASNRHRTVF